VLLLLLFVLVLLIGGTSYRGDGLKKTRTKNPNMKRRGRKRRMMTTTWRHLEEEVGFDAPTRLLEEEMEVEVQQRQMHRFPSQCSLHLLPLAGSAAAAGGGGGVVVGGKAVVRVVVVVAVAAVAAAPSDVAGTVNTEVAADPRTAVGVAAASGGGGCAAAAAGSVDVGDAPHPAAAHNGTAAASYVEGS